MPPCDDLAGVDEQGAVERPPRLPSVLRADEDGVAILEAELPEAAKGLCPAERGFEVERDLLPSARIREDRRRVERHRVR